MSFYANQDLYSGNRLSYCDVPKGQSHATFRADASCAKLGEVIFEFLTANPARAADVLALGIECDALRLDVVNVSVTALDDYADDDEDEDDEDEEPSRQECGLGFCFSIATRSPLSDDAIRWICHEFASTCFPDGGWDSMEVADVDFEVEELSPSEVIKPISMAEIDAAAAIAQGKPAPSGHLVASFKVHAEASVVAGAAHEYFDLAGSLQDRADFRFWFDLFQEGRRGAGCEAFGFDLVDAVVESASLSAVPVGSRVAATVRIISRSAVSQAGLAWLAARLAELASQPGVADPLSVAMTPV